MFARRRVSVRLVHMVDQRIRELVRVVGREGLLATRAAEREACYACQSRPPYQPSVASRADASRLGLVTGLVTVFEPLRAYRALPAPMVFQLTTSGLPPRVTCTTLAGSWRSLLIVEDSAERRPGAGDVR